MFGTNDTANATMGSPTVQNPSMLDNVSAQDFQTPSAPAPEPASQAAQPVAHPLVTDNPFIKQDIVAATSTTPPSQGDFTSQQTPMVDSSSVSSSIPPTTSPSAPVDPPVVNEPAHDDQSSYVQALTEEALPSDESAKTKDEEAIEPVDHEKLADMKREALEHLEPLADHIEGTPEETFRTTMMMIQANDNHTLLEKALEAAKKIDDDKVRAQALLDIINEINYFSQI